MLGILAGAAWDLVKFNNFELPKLAFEGLKYLIGSGSSLIR